MELAKATGALVALSGGMAGQVMVIDVLPGSSPLALELPPGMMAEGAKMAVMRAHQQAHRHDLRAVTDAGGVHPRISCGAARRGWRTAARPGRSGIVMGGPAGFPSGLTAQAARWPFLRPAARTGAARS